VSSTVATPVDWLETVGNLRIPAKADHRLQDLMEKNSEGQLSQPEKEELEAMVELSEQLALIRGEALQLLGKRP
jgi:hypothetical protein